MEKIEKLADAWSQCDLREWSDNITDAVNGLITEVEALRKMVAHNGPLGNRLEKLEAANDDLERQATNAQSRIKKLEERMAQKSSDCLRGSKWIASIDNRSRDNADKIETLESSLPAGKTKPDAIEISRKDAQRLYAYVDMSRWYVPDEKVNWPELRESFINLKAKIGE